MSVNYFENCAPLGYYAVSSGNSLPTAQSIGSTLRAKESKLTSQKSAVFSYFVSEASNHA